MTSSRNAPMVAIKDSQKTGYTYQGREIVLAKTQGRPVQGLVKKGIERGIYPDSTFIRAVTFYAALGSMPRVAELTGVPEHTLYAWRKTPKFKEMLLEIRDENNEKIDATFTQIVEKSLAQVLDRIENGDIKVNVKTGETYRQAVSAKDLSIVTAITVDKRQVLRGLPNTRTEAVVSENDKLASLAASFEKLANQKKSGITYTVQVEDAVIENQSEPIGRGGDVTDVPPKQDKEIGNGAGT